MKIAHLIAQFYPNVGGAEICVHNVCRTLSENGHKAVVITTTAEPVPSPDVPYDIEYLWSKTCGLLRKIPFIGKRYLHSQLAKLQKKHQFDLWQVTGGYPLGVYAVDYFRKKNIPCILRCCGEDIQKFPEINYGYRLDETIDTLSREYYVKYDGLVALTPTVRNEYQALNIKDDIVLIIPNGADFAKFAKVRENESLIAGIRKKYNVGQKKLILTTGRYHPKKGFDQIPEIAGKLKEKGLEFIWIVAGNGTCEIIRKFPECSELGIICSEDYTKSETEAFSLPPQSLIELYCASDIYVLPTLIETFGMVLVEAMAGGLPIITTNAPGVNDVIEGYVNGLKAETKNIEDICAKILEVINDKDLSDKLSQNALKSAQSKYDWQVVTSRYVDFYKHVIGT